MGRVKGIADWHWLRERIKAIYSTWWCPGRNGINEDDHLFLPPCLYQVCTITSTLFEERTWKTFCLECPNRRQSSIVVTAVLVADTDQKNVWWHVLPFLYSRSICSLRKCVAQEMQGS